MIQDQSNSRSIAAIGSILVLFLTISSSAQTGLIKKDLLRIQPGVSTLNDVEQEFGTLEVNNFSSRIVTNESLTTVDFSRGDCSTSTWRFPIWIVEEVTIFPNSRFPLTLSEVLLDRSRFKSRKPSDVLTHIEYYNEELGISVEYDRKLKRVESIRLRPRKDLIDQHLCENQSLMGSISGRGRLQN